MRVVAVSKTKSVPVIGSIYDAGLLRGNYIQELIDKAPQVGLDCSRVHLQNLAFDLLAVGIVC